MPKLPEVEHFLQLLLPLILSSPSDGGAPLKLERLTLDRSPPRKFLSEDDIATINEGHYYCSRVERKGKLICMVLNDDSSAGKTKTTKYMFLHMGMIGRIPTLSTFRRWNLSRTPPNIHHLILIYDSKPGDKRLAFPIHASLGLSHLGKVWRKNFLNWLPMRSWT